ncbi:MAG: hypothetical protein K0S45_4182 [Nitrospira sp.]|jgi:hypothetical protein|nr:hypothetical protein [Nitrospira sp.]
MDGCSGSVVLSQPTFAFDEADRSSSSPIQDSDAAERGCAPRSNVRSLFANRWCLRRLAFVQEKITFS